MAYQPKMSAEVREWTNEQVIRLIIAYKDKPMLWDPNHDLYRVQTAKYEAWCELAAEFGCEMVDLRKKFNSIFASHRREKTKVRLGGRSTWFLYHHLSFLPGHMDHNQEDESKMHDGETVIIGFGETKTRSRSKTPEEIEYLEERFIEQSSDLEDYDDNRSNSPVHIIVKEEEPEIIAPTAKYFKQKHLQKRRVIKNKLRDKNKFAHSKILKRNKLQYIKKDESINQTYEKKEECDTNYSKAYTNKDECDSFGEYIAVSLRKHDERTRSMIKQAINNILFEQEMKKYNAGNYTVIYTAVDENPLIVPDECEK